MKKGVLHLIGCASGIAGADIHSGDGPLLIQASKYISHLEQEKLITWDAMLTLANSPDGRKDERVHTICVELANNVAASLKKRQRTAVIGGDHSCAIGTWSGVYDVYHQQGDIGLIWFDAHMDAHTPETTPSGNIHGMPVAALLGYGYPTLTNILHDAAKIKPENLCLIGTRSFESGEAALLKKLNVKTYYMDEIKQRGFRDVLQEAIHHVSKHTIGYGFSLDLDGIDPEDAPGVDVPEPNGVSAIDLFASFPILLNDPRLLMMEIVEFDPRRDRDKITENLLIALIEMLAGA